MNIATEPSDLYCTYMSTKPDPQRGTILVTGATGYIGGRLVPELLARGYTVRVMIRTAIKEAENLWPAAEVVVADALKPDSLITALAGIDTAYYLIHSLLLGPRQFVTADNMAAHNFRIAAEKAGVKRVIYLGGLGDMDSDLSPHLRSRINVAEELQAGLIPVTILRAAIIIGSGSASYEIIKHLVKNTPVLPIPTWGKTLCQPIAVRDVVKYLVGVLENPATAGNSYDIGGTEIIPYEDMLRTLADILGKRIVYLRMPLSSIPVYAYIASLITPVPHAITRCLMESIGHEVVCRNDVIRSLVPFPMMSFRESLVSALSREDQDRVATRWSDAYPPAHELAIKLHECIPAPQYTATYSIWSDKSSAAIFRSACRVGGREGWFNNNWMWYLRGWFDRILLGIGLSRGRKNQNRLRVNDVIDFWRVEDLIADQLLLLRAEMKMPGKAWLKFTISEKENHTRLEVSAYYSTMSIPGKMYWYFFLPFHFFIFKGLIKQIESRA